MASFRCRALDRWRRLLATTIATCAWVAPAPSSAYTVKDLYVAAVPLPDGGTRATDAAFTEALGIVLVRVSGLADAPAQLTGMLGNPRSYVQRYGIDSEGRLTVGFDPVAIDRLLTDAGLPIWGRERPTTLMLAYVIKPNGQSEWLSADSTEPARESIDTASGMRGVPLIWPLLAADDQRVLQSFELGSVEPEALQDLRARYRADAVLVSRLEQSETGELSGDWTLGFGEDVDRTSGDPEIGMALAAQRYVSVYGASASNLTLVEVDVSGIEDLIAYARTLDYLEDLTLTEQVSIEELAGDSMRLRLSLRGDSATFERAIALDDRLVRIETPDIPGRLSYRYQP